MSVVALDRPAAIDPTEAIRLRAQAHENRAELDAACEQYRCLVAVAPKDIQGWRRIVEIGLAIGDLEAVADDLGTWLTLDPDNVDAVIASGEHAILLGDVAFARVQLRRALALVPDHPLAGLLRAGLLECAGDKTAAIAQLKRCAHKYPNAAAVRFGLARLLVATGKPGLARAELSAAETVIAADDADRAPIEQLIRAQCFASAAIAIDERLARNPRDVNAIELRARMYQEQSEIDTAAIWFARAVDLDASKPIPACRLATRLERIGATARAAAVLDRVLLRWPHFGVARTRRALLLSPIAADLATAEQSRRDFTAGVKRLTRDTPRFGPDQLTLLSASFWLPYQGENDRADLQALARLYLAACPALAFTAPHVNRRTQRTRLRVGLLSGCFSHHVVARLYHRIIEHLDRQRFEVVLIHSPDGNRDYVTAQLNAIADGSIELPNDLLESQQVLARLELDILFYPDVGMSHTSYFRSFGRYARVQCTSWGHPNTTGIPSIDYFISSKRLEVPHADDHYSEKLIRFNDLPMIFERPVQGQTFDRARHGLPQEATLYACLQTTFKFHPKFDEVIAGILRSDPRAIILTVGDKTSDQMRVLHERWARDLPVAIDRVHVLPRLSEPDFVAALAAADVAIDTYPFAGGNTSFQSLGAGVPLITLPNDYLRSRCGTGAYHQIGFGDLVARDPLHYIELAVRTANDRDFRARCVEAIRDGESRLFETEHVIHEFNDFFASAYEASFKEGALA